MTKLNAAFHFSKRLIIFSFIFAGIFQMVEQRTLAAGSCPTLPTQMIAKTENPTPGGQSSTYLSIPVIATEETP